LDSVIQENASSSEELASTAVVMNDKAAELKELIAFFQLDGVTKHREKTGDLNVNRVVNQLTISDQGEQNLIYN